MNEDKIKEELTAREGEIEELRGQLEQLNYQQYQIEQKITQRRQSLEMALTKEFGEELNQVASRRNEVATKLCSVTGAVQQLKQLLKEEK